MSPWISEFSVSYRVPRPVVELVEAGRLEDMSFHADPCPSFGRKLRSNTFLRLWVEHPEVPRRVGFSSRFTVAIQPDPAVAFYWKALSTDDEGLALRSVRRFLYSKAEGCRLRIVREGVI